MRWAGSRAQGPILMARRGLCCRAACCVRAWCVSEAARLGRVAHAGGHAAQRAQVRRHQRLRKRRRRVRPRLALVVDAEHEHLRGRWSRVAPSPALGAVGALQGDGLARAAPAGAPRPGRRAGRALASAILCSWYAFCVRPRLRLANDCRICAVPCAAAAGAQRAAPRALPGSRSGLGRAAGGAPWASPSPCAAPCCGTWSRGRRSAAPRRPARPAAPQRRAAAAAGAGGASAGASARAAPHRPPLRAAAY